jgi:hypothetical protein
MAEGTEDKAPGLSFAREDTGASAGHILSHQ